jgi:preprotein translocase subunit SecF
MHLFSPSMVRTVALALSLWLLAPAVLAAGASALETGGESAPAAGSAQQAAVTEEQAPEAAQALSEDEAAELSARAEEPARDVVGGALSNTHLTYVVIALAAAVIVLIAK